MELVQFVGLLATVFSTATLVPSVLYQLKNKSAGKTDIMLLGQVMLNNILWITYGALQDDIFVFGRSLVAGCICMLSIVLFYKYTTRDV
jgi:uncharacterized protein with PQ loop repeat